MAIICPTVTAESLKTFNKQAATNAEFAKRVHFDFMDGILTPNKSPRPGEVSLPKGVASDFHLMYQKPKDYLEEVISLKPHLVVIHEAAKVDHIKFAAALHKAGIKAGLCLLQQSEVKDYEEVLKEFDHLLIFSGTLGHFGGEVNYMLLAKAHQAKKLHPGIEVGWDGGINDQNVGHLAKGGIDVLNVGGFIQKTERPQAAYATLKSLIG